MGATHFFLWPHMGGFPPDRQLSFWQRSVSSSVRTFPTVCLCLCARSVDGIYTWSSGLMRPRCSKTPWIHSNVEIDYYFRATLLPLTNIHIICSPERKCSNMMACTLWTVFTWTFKGILCTCRFLWVSVFCIELKFKSSIHSSVFFLNISDLSRHYSHVLTNICGHKKKSLNVKLIPANKEKKPNTIK